MIVLFTQVSGELGPGHRDTHGSRSPTPSPTTQATLHAKPDTTVRDKRQI
jgi:hypothetical protein